jgi:hypothetical protein
MKKILSITMMLVAIMVATVSFSSCSKDDNKDEVYKLDVSLKIDQPGSMTTEQCQKMITQAAGQSTSASYPSDEAAELGTGITAEALAIGLQSEANKFGDAVFIYTLKCTRSNGIQVITYYVEFDKGIVTHYNNKN